MEINSILFLLEKAIFLKEKAHYSYWAKSTGLYKSRLHKPIPESPTHYPRKFSKGKFDQLQNCLLYAKLKDDFSGRREQEEERHPEFSRSRAKQCPACFRAVHLSHAVSAPLLLPESPEAPLDLLIVAFSASPWSLHGFSESLELL